MTKKWYRLPQLVLPLSHATEDFTTYLSEFFTLPEYQIHAVKIIRKSLDARGRREPRFNYALDLLLDEEIRNELVAKKQVALEEVTHPTMRRLEQGVRKLNARPVVVGLGPAGLFAALRLAEYGYQPLVLERGDGLLARTEKVERFWQDGELDPESNLQFGSGGAGAFSDGKLVTRIRNPHLSFVLATMVQLGAPPEIEYWHKPHVGTDYLRVVVENLQNRIIAAGGELRFRTRVKRPLIRDGKVTGIELVGGEKIETSVIVLATGHSARDLYAELHKMGLPMEAKPFAIGLRVEHPQELIDRAQYGRWAGKLGLGPADYRLTYHHQPTGRGVYSFCMCPGGTVVAAASEESTVVTNGMSNYARHTGVANSALVVTVGPKDFGLTTDQVLAGVAFQRHWEKSAYQLGGEGYKAPAQKVQDFLAKETTKKFGWFRPTYRPGVNLADLNKCLPEFVAQPLAEGIRYFDRLIPGFSGKEAVLTGVETRTSAPVRIIRGEDYQSPGSSGLYPCGEGSGYAGGITSSAVDGLEAANRIITTYAPSA